MNETLLSTGGEAYVLLNDSPYAGTQDPLDFDDLAMGLKELIHGSRESTPLTLGVQAPWGMGKSTLLAKLQQEIEKVEGARTVWFNAWSFEGQDIHEALVKSVLMTLDPNALRKALVKRRLLSVLKAVTQALPGIFQIDLGDAVNTLWEAASDDPRARSQVLDIVQSVMAERMQKGAEFERGRLIAVFIDDLDRCSPENVFKVFEAMKHYLDAAGFVFVIGFDHGIVSEAILEHKKYSRKITSGQYLEKIIQIDYGIPRPTEEQIGRLFDENARASQTRQLLGETEEKLIIERSDFNPRRIKRFINRFILEQRLGEDSADLAPELLIKILLLQMYFRPFRNLFSTRARKNPISEFVDYVEARTILRRDQDLESDLVKQVFEFYDLAHPTSLDAIGPAIQALDEAVPEEFSEFSQNPDFIDFVRSLGEQSEREQVAQWILRKRETAEAGLEDLEEQDKLSQEFEPGSLRGLRVLWVDDHPEKNAPAVERVQDFGGRVEAVTSGDLAMKRLSWANVLISDIRRGDEEEVGFRDLERFRSEAGFEAPAIFFASRISAAQRKTAMELNAYGVTKEVPELLRMLRALAEAEGAKVAV